MRYLKNLIEKHRHGPWKAILLGYLAFCVLSGITCAWGDYHFLSSALLWTLTSILYLPLIVGPFALAFWVGLTVDRLSRLKVVGWIAGLVTAFFVIGLLYKTVSHIPGIGWRFNVMLESSHGDY